MVIFDVMYRPLGWGDVTLTRQRNYLIKKEANSKYNCKFSKIVKIIKITNFVEENS